MRILLSPYDWIICNEPSVEPSLMMINSKSWKVCPRMLLMASRIKGSLLQTLITTLTLGMGTFSFRSA